MGLYKEIYMQEKSIPYAFCLEFLVIHGHSKQDNNKHGDVLDDT